MAMFSSSTPKSSNSGHIVEFKAGRSTLEAGSSESKKRVVADKKKGLVFVKQTNDLLVHFCWKDRDSGALVDDLIIFPGDTEFKEVKGAPEGSKVYMLKFKSSKEMRIYWLQDGNPDADKDLVQKVNDALNKPPPARASARGGSSERGGLNTGSGFPAGLNLNDVDFSGPLGGLDQQQLMSLIQTLQGGGSDVLPLPATPSTASSQAPAAATSSTPAATTTTQPSGSGAGLTTSDLSKILNNLTTPGASTQRKKVNVQLSEALSNDSVLETAKSNSSTLTGHLPQTNNTAQKELEETVRAPQFRQATDTFGHALQTGQLGPVLSQFGIDGETVDAANKGDLREFARNLTKAEGGELPEEEKEAEKDEAGKEPEPKRNRPDLEDMDVD